MTPDLDAFYLFADYERMDPTTDPHGVSESFMNLPDPNLPTPAIAAVDRRRHPRYTVNVPIEIHEDGSNVPLRFETTDLSRGGCYIQLMIPLSVGVRLRATVWLDGCPVIVRGLVVTRHPQFGNGIMFVEFDGEGDKLLQQYLDAITA